MQGRDRRAGVQACREAERWSGGRSLQVVHESDDHGGARRAERPLVPDRAVDDHQRDAHRVVPLLIPAVQSGACTCEWQIDLQSARLGFEPCEAYISSSIAGVIERGFQCCMSRLSCAIIGCNAAPHSSCGTPRPSASARWHGGIVRHAGTGSWHWHDTRSSGEKFRELNTGRYICSFIKQSTIFTNAIDGTQRRDTLATP